MEVMEVQFVPSNTKLTAPNNSETSLENQKPVGENYWLDFLFFVIVSLPNVSATLFASSSTTMLEIKQGYWFIQQISEWKTKPLQIMSWFYPTSRTARKFSQSEFIGHIFFMHPKSNLSLSFAFQKRVVFNNVPVWVTSVDKKWEAHR